MHILRYRLQCDCLPAVRAFYVDRLGMTVASEGERHLALQCGASILEFAEGTSGIYHFAFNIPHDLVEVAADWVEARGIDLLPFEGNRLVPFPNWNAQAIYFHDPAGNIVEFIGRRRLPASGKDSFTIADIVCLSEVGFPSYDHAALRQRLESEMGIPVFGSPTEVFAALGDDHGLFIKVDAGHKRWIPNMEPALPLPFQVELRQAAVDWHLEWTGDALLTARI